MKIKCNHCKSVLKSTSRHHFAACKCYIASEALCNAFRDVLKANRSKGILLTDSSALSAFYEVVFKGVALDGGDIRSRIIGDMKTVEIIK